MQFQRLFRKLLDIVYPRRCEICAAQVDRFSRHICSNCLCKIEFAPQDGCAICAKPISSGDHGNLLCEDCSGRNKPFFDRAASACVFDGFLRQMLLDYKFNFHIWLKNDFVDFLEASARARFNLNSIDLVLPMPISLGHKFDRGFNQCDYLAKAFAKKLGKKYSANLLSRINSPSRQSRLSEKERKKNVIGTFKVKNPSKIKGRVILVIDDIMTTGATLSECAKTLKEAGALKVLALTLASTRRG